MLTILYEDKCFKTGEDGQENLFAIYSYGQESPEFDVSHMTSEQIDHYLNEQGIFDLEYWEKKRRGEEVIYDYQGQSQQEVQHDHDHNHEHDHSHHDHDGHDHYHDHSEGSVHISEEL